MIATWSIGYPGIIPRSAGKDRIWWIYGFLVNRDLEAGLAASARVAKKHTMIQIQSNQVTTRIDSSSSEGEVDTKVMRAAVVLENIGLEWSTTLQERMNGVFNATTPWNSLTIEVKFLSMGEIVKTYKACY